MPRSSNTLRFLRAHHAHGLLPHVELLSAELDAGNEKALLAVRLPREEGRASKNVAVLLWPFTEERRDSAHVMDEFEEPLPLAVHSFSFEGESGFLVVTSRSVCRVAWDGAYVRRTYTPPGEIDDPSRFAVHPDHHRYLWSSAGKVWFWDPLSRHWSIALEGLACFSDVDGAVLCAGREPGAASPIVSLRSTEDGSAVFTQAVPGVGAVTALACDPQLALIAWGDTLECWDMERRQTLWRVSYLTPIRQVAFAESGAWVVPDEGPPWRVELDRGRTVQALDASGSFRRAWVGSPYMLRARRVSLEWIDLDTGRVSARNPLRRSGVVHLAWSPDGQWIASAGEDSTIRVTRARTGEVHWSFETHPHVASDIAFSLDGRQLLACTRGGVRVWDLATGTELAPWPEHHAGEPRALALSPDGVHAVCVHALSRAMFGLVAWDVCRGVPLRALGPLVRPNSEPRVSFGPADAGTALVLEQHQPPWLLSLYGGGPIRDLDDVTEPYFPAPQSGFRFTVVGYRPNGPHWVVLHEGATGRVLGRYGRSPLVPPAWHRSVVAPDGRHAVEIDGDSLRVYPVGPAATAPIDAMDFSPDEDAPTGAAFSPDGRTLAVGTCQGAVVLLAFDP